MNLEYYIKYYMVGFMGKNFNFKNQIIRIMVMNALTSDWLIKIFGLVFSKTIGGVLCCQRLYILRYL